jgi:hypothetical protein
MVGAVLCLLSFGILFLGTLCGLVAVILLSISKDEFQPRVVYVDERAYGYGDQQGYYEEGEYYDDGGGYDAYGQQAAPAEAPPIQLVDQYGASQEHQYNEAEHRYR